MVAVLGIIKVYCGQYYQVSGFLTGYLRVDICIQFWCLATRCSLYWDGLKKFAI